MGLDTGFQRDVQTLQAQAAADAKEQQEQESRDGNTVSIYRIKPGKAVIRVLPAYSSAGVWFRETTQHYIGSPYTCPRPFGTRCPICEEGERLFNEGTEESGNRSKDFRPRKSFLFNVIVLSDSKGTTAQKGVQVLQAPETVKRELLYYDVNESEGYGDMTNVNHGFNITIERTGTTKTDTKYRVIPFPQRTNIEEQLKVQGVDPSTMRVHNLDALFPPQDYETLKAALEGRAAAPGFPPVAAGSAPAPAPQVPTAPDPSQVPGTVFPSPTPVPGTVAPQPNPVTTVVGQPNAGVPASTGTTVTTPVQQPEIPNIPAPPGETNEGGTNG